MKGRLDAARLRVDAPDAVSAFRLERRLHHLHPVAVGRGRHWEVDVEHYDGGAEAIVPVVRQWLDDVGLSRTTVWIDGSRTDVAAPRRGRTVRAC